MLVLSRKEGERLVIGENITLVISKVVGNRVTIGIEAPKDVKVMRGELTVESNQPLVEPERKPDRKPSRKPCAAAISMKDFTSSVRMLQRNVG
jgi:carbon storage regulator CsrA